MGVHEQAKHTRSAIFAACRELLRATDPERITIEGISRRAGIGRTTFYLHFESRDELYQAIVTHELGTLLELAGTLGAIDPGEPGAVESFIDRCSTAWARCRVFLGMAIVSVTPREHAEGTAFAHDTAVQNALGAMRARGITPGPQAEAELLVGLSLLTRLCFVYPALGERPFPPEWRGALAEHLRLALTRARPADPPIEASG